MTEANKFSVAMIPTEMPKDKKELRKLIEFIDTTYFADGTIARGTALSPLGRGVEWRLLPSDKSAVSEGKHLQMIPEPERALTPVEAGVLMMGATIYAATISPRHRVAMNGPDTTLHPGAPPHVHIMLAEGEDRFPRVSGNLQAALEAADMPKATREDLQGKLLQKPRRKL